MSVVTSPQIVGAGEVAASRDGRLILRNALALTASRPLTWLATAGLTVLLPRYLGDANLGKLNFAWVFADWAGLLASLGLASYTAREVARDSTNRAHTAMNALALRLTTAAVIGIVVVLVSLALPMDSLTRTLLCVLTAHMLMVAIASILTGILQGAQELRVVALVDAWSKGLQCVLIVGVLLNGADPVAVAGGYVLADLVAVGWLFTVMKSRVGLRGPVLWRSWGPTVKRASPFLIWEAALLTYARVDVLILALFAQDAVLGWYAAAYRIISIPLFLPTVIMTAIFPALAGSARDVPWFNSLVQKGIQVGGITTMPMAAGLTVTGSSIVDFLGYPVEFSNSVVPLAILAVTLPLVAINMVTGSALAALDRQRAWALIGVVAAVLNVGLNFAAIPYTQHQFGNGAIGAAAVTSLTEVWLLCAGFALLPRGVIDRPTVLVLLRSAAAGAVMVAVLWPVHDWTVLLTIPLGASVYALAIFAFRAVSLRDVRQLRQQLRPA